MMRVLLFGLFGFLSVRASDTESASLLSKHMSMMPSRGAPVFRPGDGDYKPARTKRSDSNVHAYLSKMARVARVEVDEGGREYGQRVLSTVPPEIFTYAVTIRKLNLGCNILKGLPKKIGDCVNLTDLDVHGNQLESLPPEIGNCTKLATFDASSNYISTIPEEIGHCAALKTLNLQFNDLGELPLNMENLSSLEVLYIAHNHLKKPIPNVPSLMELDKDKKTKLSHGLKERKKKGLLTVSVQ